jgi:hypothetical protein
MMQLFLILSKKSYRILIGAEKTNGENEIFVFNFALSSAWLHDNDRLTLHYICDVTSFPLKGAL